MYSNLSYIAAGDTHDFVVPVGPTAPIGGPYSTDFQVAVQLDSVVTQNDGTDMLITWSSNKSGSFNNTHIENPIFTPTDHGDYILTLTVTTSNASPIILTANLTSLGAYIFSDSYVTYSGLQGGATVVVNYPAGIQVGDICVYYVTSRDGMNTSPEVNLPITGGNEWVDLIHNGGNFTVGTTGLSILNVNSVPSTGFVMTSPGSNETAIRMLLIKGGAYNFGYNINFSTSLARVNPSVQSLLLGFAVNSDGGGMNLVPTGYSSYTPGGLYPYHNWIALNFSAPPGLTPDLLTWVNAESTTHLWIADA